MKYNIFPENKKILLVSNNDNNIPSLGLYNSIELKNLKEIMEKEDELIKENYRIFSKKLKELGDEKIKQLNKYKLFSFTKNLEIENFKPPKGWSNAYRKMYEICQDFNFIPKLKNIRHLDLCSFPCGFIFATNDYLKTKTKIDNYDFYFQSFIPTGLESENFFEDKYHMRTKYFDRFVVKNQGDITSLEEINHIEKFFKKNKCNIVTSDCGLESKVGSEYKREKQMTKTFFGQFLGGLMAIKKNGNFLMKYYHFYSIFNASLIYLMGLLFKKVYLVKPSSSRQFTGKEIYIMCIGYKDNLSDKNIDKMKNILVNFEDKNINKSLINEKDIDKEILNKIEKKLSEFFEYRINRTYQKYKLADEYIGLDWSENFYKYLKKKKELNKISQKIEKEYFKEYLNKMNFVQLKEKDRL